MTFSRCRRDVQLDPQWLVGPVAGLAILLWVVRELWKAHREADADVREQRDAAVERLERVIGLAERAKDPPKS